jgi:competence protein ComEA
MDLIGEERGRLTRAAQWLQATRAELVGLATLLAGCVALTGVLWWSSATGPQDLHEDVGRDGGSIGAEVDLDDLERRVDGDGAWDDEGLTGPGDHAHADDGPASTLVVHVSGAVAAPGIVTLPDGSRVGDAVTRAGGPTDDAWVDRLNLAQPLSDGERVHVPAEGEEDPPSSSGAAPSADGGAAPRGPVDLNRAGAEELETLPGIGPTRARAIVDHRETHGPFGEPGDLRAVAGIGEATFQQLADLVSVS